MIMEFTLLEQFEQELINESRRILNIMLKQYKNKKEVNKTFGEIIRELIQKKYKFYACDIEFKIEDMLPYDLIPDPNGEYIFIKRIINVENIISNYSISVMGDRDRNPIRGAFNLADIIIKMSKENKLGKCTLHEFMAENLKTVYKNGYDSQDVKAVISYLSGALRKKGYRIVSTDPFIIK